MFGIIAISLIIGICLILIITIDLEIIRANFFIHGDFRIVNWVLILLIVTLLTTCYTESKVSFLSFSWLFGLWHDSNVRGGLDSSNGIWFI